MDAWEVQMDFEIGGGGSRGADGMALWYVAEPKKEGISMGSAEEYRGMAVYFDTFDNDGQVQFCARLVVATHHRTRTRTTKVLFVCDMGGDELTYVCALLCTRCH
jgi:hypothetical protein